MYSKLGDIIFDGLFGPSSFSLTGEAKYAVHELIEGKPRLQRVGSGLNEISISIKFLNSFCDPETELNRLLSYRDAGTILPYVTGDGVSRGDYVIKTIGENPRQLTREGKIVEIDLEVSLIEYVIPDRAASQDEAAKQNGFANSNNNPAPVIADETPHSDIMQASASVTEGSTEINAATELIEDGAANPATMQSDFDKANEKLTNATNAFNEALVSINNTTGSINSQLQGLVGDINQVLALIPGVQIDLSALNASGAVAQLTPLASAMNGLQSSGATLAGFAALKK